MGINTERDTRTDTFQMAVMESSKCTYCGGSGIVAMGGYSACCKQMTQEIHGVWAKKNDNARGCSWRDMQFAIA